MNNSSRAWVGFVLGAIAVLLVIWSMPLHSITPKGIVLPVDGYKSPLDSEVNIYNQVTAPFFAKTIGSISVMYHTTQDGEQQQQAVVNAAKSMAAAAGGNGIVLNVLAHTYPDQPTALAAIVLRGTVLRSVAE